MHIILFYHFIIPCTNVHIFLQGLQFEKSQACGTNIDDEEEVDNTSEGVNVSLKHVMSLLIYMASEVATSFYISYSSF